MRIHARVHLASDPTTFMLCLLCVNRILSQDNKIRYNYKSEDGTEVSRNDDFGKAINNLMADPLEATPEMLIASVDV